MDGVAGVEETRSTRAMETYPLDIDPAQVLRWLKRESEVSPATFRIAARRAQEMRQLPVAKEAHLGDEEREDLSEVATVATLEVAPVHANEGWQLRIVVEDELGPRTSDERGGDGEQTIDLGTFDHEFIRRGSGIANVFAEVDGAAGRARLERLLGAIEKDRHVADGGSRL